MMAKKDLFPPGYSSSFAPHYESEGSGSSGRIDLTEDSSAPMRKWIDLNSASRDGFAVPVQLLPLSKMSSSERKTWLHRLTLELEQIRLLQKRLESHQKKNMNTLSVSSFNHIMRWNNAPQKGLQNKSKKSAGSGSGSGKKSRGCNRGATVRFESAPSAPERMRMNPHAGLLKQCESLLNKLMSQQYAWVFNTPVDVVKLNIPDYFDVIKNPMDLGTIKSKLSSAKYSSPLDFLADVRLTFTNAKTYNPPGTDVHIMADTMSQFFELRWKAIERKINTKSFQSLPDKLEVHEEADIAKPMAASKKRKVSPVQHEVVQRPIQRIMTDEEKHKISSELENLGADLPDSVIEFLRAQSSNRCDCGEDEIEIDIDDLSNDTLFTLRKLLDDHLEKQKNLGKSEACEIELPNVSGLSNSSLQADKGNDHTDEDVDIGGDEAPVTSYPSVEIDKDTGQNAEECNQPGLESRTTSDRGSECFKGSSAVKHVEEYDGHTAYADKKSGSAELIDQHPSMSGLDQLERSSVPQPCSSDSDGYQDGENAQAGQVSPDKLYRAAILKNRFLDTILKAREKTLKQDDKGDPEKLRREREELEMQKMKEKARLQAEAKAAEAARKRAEEEAAAEAKRRRELEREAAREALLKVERTVEINETSRFLEDLEILKNVPADQLPGPVDEMSPENSPDGFGSFKFGEGSNPLEQLGLFMKEEDEEEEEGEPPSAPTTVAKDVEEGEID